MGGAGASRMERRIEAALLSARWLLLPLYLALLAMLAAIYVAVGRELWHVAAHILSASEAEIVLAVLSVLDLVLLANLVLMVAISSYESFVSRIAGDPAHTPEWLGTLNSGHVKVKVAVSVLLISAINLLRLYMTDGDRDRMATMAGVHLVFILSAVATAAMDRIGRAAH